MTVLTDRDSVEEFSEEDDEYLGSAEFPDYWDNIDKKRKILSVVMLFSKRKSLILIFYVPKRPFLPRLVKRFFELSVV